MTNAMSIWFPVECGAAPIISIAARRAAALEQRQRYDGGEGYQRQKQRGD